MSAKDWTAMAALTEGQTVKVDGKSFTVETVVNAGNLYLRGVRGALVNLLFMDFGPQYVTGWRLVRYGREGLPTSHRERCTVEIG